MMRHILIALTTLFLITSAHSQAAEVDFVYNDLQRAQKTAKKENKIIFVDGYTSWCGPCKWMDANVFADPKVSKFFNNSFVNLKMDLEDGEGVDFAQTYNTIAFPTFYFLSADGKVLHKALGAFDAQSLMQIAYDALRPESQLAGFQQRHQSEKQNGTFLKDYAMLLKKLRIEDSESVVKDYLNTQTDWTGETNTKFIYDNVGIDLDGKLFQYMLQHVDQFYEHVGTAKTDQKILNGIHGSLGPEGSPQDVEDKVRTLLPKQSQRIVDWMYLNDLMAGSEIQDMTIFTNMAYFYVHQWKPEDWEFVNNLAWIIYEEGQNKEHFERGKSIALESVAIDDNYFNNDTVAALCYMLKQKDEALRYAQKAIQQAQDMGVSSASTQTLIQMIQQL